MKYLISLFLVVWGCESYAGWVCFSKTVTAAGTAEPLKSSSYQVLAGTIQAKSSNTTAVELLQKGGSNGITLTAGQGFNLSLNATNKTFDLANIYLDATTSSEGINFCGYTP